MKEFRVRFDVWFHENSLYSDGEVDQAIADLRARGDIYEKDGATWFESTKHGDDKDRVIIKSDATTRTSPPTSPTTATSATARPTRPTWRFTCSAPTTTATSAA